MSISNLDPNVIRDHSVDKTDDAKLTMLGIIASDVIDREILRLSNREKLYTLVSSNLLDLYYNDVKFALFSTEQLEVTLDIVFKNVELRDWVLNVTVRLLYQLKLNGLELDEIINLIASSQETIVDSHESILGLESRMQLKVNVESIKKTLSNNKWLITIYLISYHLDDTIFYTTTIGTTS